MHTRSVVLQPVISAEIMELHHKKHHQTYVNTFNTLAEQLSDAEAKNDVAKMIALQGGIKFNGGGASCASLTWII
jgi:superoxide dismutase, Fe-Mn family